MNVSFRIRTTGNRLSLPAAGAVPMLAACGT